MIARFRSRAPVEIDERLVGLSFIEVLFALVIAQALAPVSDYQSIPAVGWAHLVVAVVLTITSWIGYHNSWNRPRYFIRFVGPAWPLAQFGVDVLLVIVYWLTAVSAENTGSAIGDQFTARWETLFVAIAFALYCVWDWIGLRIRESDQFLLRPRERDIPERRHVTIIFLALAAVVAAATWLFDPSTAAPIIGIDGALIVLLMGFRVAKEVVTTDDHRARSSREPEELVDELAKAVENLRRALGREQTRSS